MYKEDERVLSQEEKETIHEHLDRQAELIKIIHLFLDANLRPPESFLDDVFSTAVKRGFPQDQVTELKKQIANAPLRDLPKTP